MSEMGGMVKVIFGLISLVATYINVSFINAKMIRNLYFHPNYTICKHAGMIGHIYDIFESLKEGNYYKSINTIRFTTW